jgi:hypothetical protein
MKLYCMQKTREFAAHVIANEAGIPIDPVMVNQRTKKHRRERQD